MFTIGAILLLVGMVWASERRERQEKAQEASRLIRQHLRLAVYLLMGVIVMLGIIADRLH
jgi:hypothetical protein